MPKAVLKDIESSDEVKPKRAPRKRVTIPKKSDVATEEILTAEAEVEAVTKTRPRRKAPTKLMKEDVAVFANDPEAPKLTLKTIGRRSIYVYAGIVATSFVAAAVIGYSDEGQINITKAIDTHNAALVAGSVASAEAAALSGQTSDSTMVIPVQNNTSNLPDGGLIASGALATPVIEMEETVSTSTATSSEAFASSTEAVATSTATSTEL